MVWIKFNEKRHINLSTLPCIQKNQDTSYDSHCAYHINIGSSLLEYSTEVERDRVYDLIFSKLEVIKID